MPWCKVETKVGVNPREEVRTVEACAAGTRAGASYRRSAVVHMFLAANSYPLDRLRRPTPPGASRRFDVFPGQLFAQIRTVNRGSNFIYDPLKRPRRCVFSASRFSAGASRDRGAAGRQPGGSRPARTDARRVLSRHTRDAPGRCPGEGSRRITGIEVAGDARQSSDRRRGR